MSIYLDVQALKNLFEENIFKPATPDQLSNRPGVKRHKQFEASKAKYLKTPYFCPYCHSKDLSGDSYNAEGNTIDQIVTCGGCGEQWQDVFTLNNVKELYQ